MYPVLKNVSVGQTRLLKILFAGLRSGICFGPPKAIND
jgi:hypothetical protein